MIVLGLDGFRDGWVAVRLEERNASLLFLRTVAEISALGFIRAAIDIPIGMTDDGERACDRLARQRLSPHGARVFSGARRWLWQDFSDPDEANVEAARRGQKKASRQLWHLGAKILEVDAFVLGHSHLDVREAHPELIFLRLNDGAPLPSKKTEEGMRLRRALVARDIPAIDDWLDNGRAGTSAKRDDVLDACACAIAARDPRGCVPEGKASADAYGLPMQIWF